MTDVQRLLDEATPLPWQFMDEIDTEWPSDIIGPDGEYVAVDREGLTPAVRERADGELILHAVNRLPDYEAAVDALERLMEYSEDPELVTCSPEWGEAYHALRRLRGES